MPGRESGDEVDDGTPYVMRTQVQPREIVLSC